jgi:nucleotide-binding universal stress UspA family protein
MSRSKVQLAVNSADVKASSRAAAEKSDGKIILVPVDFSDHSAAALEKSAEFAELMQATLIILHVVHDPGEMPGYYSKLIKKKRATRIQDIAAEAFDLFVDGLVAETPGLTALQGAHRLMVKGLPVSRILEVAKHIDPMMVVMGSQGRTGLKHLVIGSKAAQIMQLCPVPVTIVKRPKKESKS